MHPVHMVARDATGLNVDRTALIWFKEPMSRNVCRKCGCSKLFVHNVFTAPLGRVKGEEQEGEVEGSERGERFGGKESPSDHELLSPTPQI